MQHTVLEDAKMTFLKKKNNFCLHVSRTEADENNYILDDSNNFIFLKNFCFL